MAKVRNVSKSLASMEDLLQGKGAATQTRGKKPVSVHRIDIPFALDSTAEMQALDVTLFTRARVYSSVTSYTEYVYDEDATAGIAPNVGSGYWVESTSFIIGSGTPSFGFVAAPTYNSQIANYIVTNGVVHIDLVIDYSGLDTADTSSVTLLGLPFLRDGDASFIVQLNTSASSGLSAPHTLYVDDVGALTQLGFYYRATGARAKYNDGSILASGVIKLSVAYKVQ